MFLFTRQTAGPFIIFLLLVVTSVPGQTRKEINIPDVPGYLTLKCDFHMHTPFSDGTVWPADRVTEAWMEGLDAIAITDHIEYHAYSEDVRVDHNRSYELALPRARELGMLLVRGAEITRDMPPGHLNALFIQDASALDVDNAMQALEVAAGQNAFIFWNHPGWSGQQPDGKARWYDEHTTILEKGWLKGIEVVNDVEYYPEVFQWALEKNLTLFGNSDIHSPVYFRFDPSHGEHRPLTLVLARERSLSALREALEKGRTVVYHENQLLGKEEHLAALFTEMVKLKWEPVSLSESGPLRLQLYNASDIDMQLKGVGDGSFIISPGALEIPARRTVQLSLQPQERDFVYREIDLPLEVTNMLTAPQKILRTSLRFGAINRQAVTIMPAGKPDQFRIDMGTLPKNLEAVFTTDGTAPGKNSKKTGELFSAKGNVTLKIAFLKDGRIFGEPFGLNALLHTFLGKPVKLDHEPSPKYNGNGSNPLCDGMLGSGSYNDGNWLGFEGDDLVATLDLGQKLRAAKVKLRFFQELRSWIFLPQNVMILGSEDGETYTTLAEKTYDAQTAGDKRIEDFSAELPSKLPRFIRIVAKNQSVCPEWHYGAGGKAWLFVDEIVIE